MDFRPATALVDQIGEWEVVGRPYTTAGGKTARVRVQRITIYGAEARSSASGNERPSRRTSDDATASGFSDCHALPARLGCDGLCRVRVGFVAGAPGALQAV